MEQTLTPVDVELFDEVEQILTAFDLGSISCCV
jgi:hypothetical protein